MSNALESFYHRISESTRSSVVGQWFGRLSGRERFLVQVVIFLVIVFMIYAVIWAPIWNYRSEQLVQYQHQSADLAWMRSVEGIARRDRGGSHSRLGDLNRSASSAGIKLQRVLPDTSGGVNVRIRKQEFGKVLRWLVSIQNDYTFRIVSSQIDKDSIGLVNATVYVN